MQSVVVIAKLETLRKYGMQGLYAAPAACDAGLPSSSVYYRATIPLVLVLYFVTFVRK